MQADTDNARHTARSSTALFHSVSRQANEASQSELSFQVCMHACMHACACVCEFVLYNLETS
jgi:hypothetical protein